MYTRAARYALGAFAMLLFGAPGAFAQGSVSTASCTYERCALRIEPMPDAPFVERVVQGIDARPVPTHGLLNLKIPLFEASTDSVRQPYEAYRVHDRASRVLIGTSLVAGIASGVLLASSSTHASTLVPMFGIDLGLFTANLIEAARARSALQTAVNRYNAALPDR